LAQPFFHARLLYAFFFNASSQFTPLLNFCPLIFGLTLFGWLYSVTLTLIYDENIIFDLRHSELRSLSQERN
jgi:hypothetical protein